ncbi:hypothetical protein DFH09DRAFT_336882 [Mycena vulgaris]|nr:hypothetical protein DFH09DRAFT_336882 [Mycena vulgaris]
MLFRLPTYKSLSAPQPSSGRLIRQHLEPSRTSPRVVPPNLCLELGSPPQCAHVQRAVHAILRYCFCARLANGIRGPCVFLNPFGASCPADRALQDRRDGYRLPRSLPAKVSCSLKFLTSTTPIFSSPFGAMERGGRSSPSTSRSKGKAASGSLPPPPRRRPPSPLLPIPSQKSTSSWPLRNRRRSIRRLMRPYPSLLAPKIDGSPRPAPVHLPQQPPSASPSTCSTSIDTPHPSPIPCSQQSVIDAYRRRVRIDRDASRLPRSPP